jgi:hypothetical protein
MFGVQGGRDGSENAREGCDGDLRNEGHFRGEVGVARIGRAKGGEPGGVEKRAQSVEPPASQDDIMGGEQQRQPLRWSVPAALNSRVGIEQVMDELRVREPVNASVAGEEIEHQKRVVVFLEAAGFFLGGLPWS